MSLHKAPSYLKYLNICLILGLLLSPESAFSVNPFHGFHKVLSEPNWGNALPVWIGSFITVALTTVVTTMYLNPRMNLKTWETEQRIAEACKEHPNEKECPDYKGS